MQINITLDQWLFDENGEKQLRTIVQNRSYQFESKVKAVEIMIEATPDELLQPPLQANCRLTSENKHKIGLFLGYGQSTEQALSDAFANAFKALV